MRPKIEPKPIEKSVPSDKFIVSKTDTRGIITYANPVFIEISGYTEDELIGANHNIIRHPDMPRTVFKLL
jgi:PAS domain S-box-containing protein|nr:PAS domain S-box protein [Sulfurihydrogenibium sp.]